ncbi:hypothetical protein Rhopal_007495-T1 [Rhodotorula paludigena]|uniref:Actin cross-linking n=1 Tax=Rhodotorula paludigena TaxID=86838 RepID=A0AAV5GPA6_9BASI|nr:hypothetical protein Rhopal_007495-T1 [Rhodotorula paludigena]
MDAPASPRRRPLSAYYAPSAPLAPASPHRSTTLASSSSRPPSPSKEQAGAGQRTRPSHRSANSLSSLAQLNLNSLASHPHEPLASLRHHHREPLLKRTNSILNSPATPWGEFTHAPFVPHDAAPTTALVHERTFEDVQERTFCKWINTRLDPLGHPPVTDLGREFSDGTRLIQLVEALTGEQLGRYNQQPVLRVQKMENAGKALKRIREMVHLTNIGPEDVVDGNRKLILGMIWSLVLRFSIADINEEGSNAKEGLLLWAQRRTAPYDEVDVQDFHSSWKDGLAFCALIHRHRPDLLDYASLRKDAGAAPQNLATAFRIADEHLGIPPLLEVEDVCSARRPDERSIMTYVAQFFHAFSSRAQAETEAKVISRFVEQMSDMMLAVNDYEARVQALLAALTSHLTSWSRAPPLPSTSYPSLLALRAALHTYRRTLRPAWARERLETQELLGNVRVKLETYKLRGYEPEVGLRVEDVTEVWDRLVEAERERSRSIALFIRRIQDEARQEVVQLADALSSQCEETQADLAALSRVEIPLEQQRRLALSLSSSRLPALHHTLSRLAGAFAAAQACDALDPAEGGEAEGGGEARCAEAGGVALGECEERVQALERAVKARSVFVENQVTARKASTLKPEQKEEFEGAFRAFDRNSEGRIEVEALGGVLGSLGVSEVNLDEVKLDEDGLVTFEAYLKYMTERAEDRPSATKLRSLFRSVAGNKDFVTDLDLTRLQLAPQALEFLQTWLPPHVSTGEVSATEAYDGVEGDDEGKQYSFDEFLAMFLQE